MGDGLIDVVVGINVVVVNSGSSNLGNPESVCVLKVDKILAVVGNI